MRCQEPAGPAVEMARPWKAVWLVGQYGQRNYHLLGRDVCFHTHGPLWQQQFERASQGLERRANKLRSAAMRPRGDPAQHAELTHVHVKYGAGISIQTH